MKLEMMVNVAVKMWLSFGDYQPLGRT